MRHWTSDLHLSHQSMTGPDGYCGRPWGNVEDMNAGLLARWNQVVDPGDEVVILGDLTLKNPAPNGQPAGWLVDWLTAANGTKTLVIGNHDRMWRAEMTYRRTGDTAPGERWRDLYRRCGVFVMAYGYSHRRTGGVPYTYSHLPMTRTAHESVTEDEYRMMVPHDGDPSWWRLHGHVHSQWQQHGQEVNVGVDAWNGYPVPDDVIQDTIRLGPVDVPARPWTADGDSDAAAVGWLR